MKRALLILALAVAVAVAPVWAQENGNEMVTRIVHLKYADANSVTSVIRPFGLRDMAVDLKLRVITLAGPKANVDAAENAIKELDVPSAAPKDVDLTVYFVVGSDEPAGPLPAPPTPAPYAPIPAELQGTVTALKQTFPFKNYSLLDALQTRVRAGTGGGAQGELSGGRLTEFNVRSVGVEAAGMSAQTESQKLGGGRTQVTGDLRPGGNNIRLDHLHAVLRRPRTIDGKTNYMDSGVDSDIVDVREGQKLVIGRSSLEGPGKALFLVLIARVAP